MSIFKFLSWKERFAVLPVIIAAVAAGTVAFALVAGVSLLASAGALSLVAAGIVCVAVTATNEGKWGVLGATAVAFLIFTFVAGSYSIWPLHLVVGVVRAFAALAAAGLAWKFALRGAKKILMRRLRSHPLAARPT